MDAVRPISDHISDIAAGRDGDLRGPDLAGMARRHWWLLAAFLLLGTLGAWKVTGIQQKVYESSTSVLVQPTGSGLDTNTVGGRTKGDVNLDTEAQLVRSTPVATAAAALLRTTTGTDTLTSHVSVDVPANTSVLVISYTGSTAPAARAGSHAFAQAYLSNREDTDKAGLANRTAVLGAKVAQLNTVLTQINARIVTLKPESAERANLDSQRQTTISQLNTLTAQFNQVSTTPPSAGTIIRDAELPDSPIRPNKLLNLASGAMVGLLVGIGAAFVRERLNRRVRRAGDLPRRAEVAVLAAVPSRSRPPLHEPFPASGTGGRIFSRLRNEILASLPAALPISHTRSLIRGQMVVVAGASRGPAATMVAANLAAAFARTGAETVLVCARLPDSVADAAPVTTLLGVRAVPGLAEVLAGQTSLAAATQRVPKQPYLRVLTPGGSGGLLQSQLLRDTLDAVRGRAAYVVVEAPSTATSADAQSLASVADAAILAVELRRTRYTEIIDATDQLRGVGTAVLGAVVMPKLARSRRPRKADPASATAPAPAPAPAPSGTAPNSNKPASNAPVPRTTGEQVHLHHVGDTNGVSHGSALPARRRDFLPSAIVDNGPDTLLTGRVVWPAAKQGDRSPGDRSPSDWESATVVMRRIDDTDVRRTIAELTEPAHGSGNGSGNGTGNGTGGSGTGSGGSDTGSAGSDAGSGTGSSQGENGGR